MLCLVCFIVFCLFGVSVASVTHVSAPLTVSDLSCEYRRDPVTIDVPAPRLSWRLQGPGRARRQTAYQIQVATSKRLLTSAPDLWDTGRVVSDQSTLVIYAGAPLKSRMTCFWRVRVWDEANRMSRWSAVSQWNMGLLHPEDWRGQWIGLDGGDIPDSLESACWIWTKDATEGNRCRFRRMFEIPTDREVISARVVIGVRSTFSISVNGQCVRSGARTIFSPTSEVDIESRLTHGLNTLQIDAGASEQSDQPSGIIAALVIEYEDGSRQIIPTDHTWEASIDEPASQLISWTPAMERASNGQAPFPAMRGDDYRRLPARMLRREFTISSRVSRAVVYFCGLGVSELYLNGRRVGDQVLSPGLTDYNKRCLYVTYDVTRNLNRGMNAIGAWLGNGRYYAPRHSAPTTTFTYGYPKMLLQLEITYANGATELLCSDTNWKITADGPLRANNEYDGELYDARREMPGWSQSGFDDSRWKQAERVAPPPGALCSEMAEPIREQESLTPVSVAEIRPGVYIADFGQNFAGWCRLHVQAPPGHRITLRHAERLSKDGSLYTDNLRSAKCTDVYIASGRGVETYTPRFVYHGFRYVEITGYPGKPSPQSITGVVVHDDLQRSGTFQCSNALVNTIYRNMYWGIRSNYRSIPTDCPQRDERQGWFGDRAQVSRGEMYVFDTAAMHTKWLRDIADSQLEGGHLPDLAPAYWRFYTNSVTFPTLAVVLPGHLYEQYGDRRILETCYPMMTRWAEMMIGQMRDDLMPKDTYGDWCVPPESPELIWSTDPNRVTNAELVASAYFYANLRTLARYAALLGCPEDTVRYSHIADRMQRAYHARWYNPVTHAYNNGSQTSYVLTLAFGLAPEDVRHKVFQGLIDHVMKHCQGHLRTGMVGSQWLMRTLSDNGRPDVAWKLATQTSFPSWGYMIARGATTIWELWNGDTGDPLMDSGNHVMQIGDLCTWLHESVAAIAPDISQPGFRHIVMRPVMPPGLDSARASRQSLYGTILSDWKRTGSGLDWEVTVPVNTTATLHVSASDPASIRESGRDLVSTPGILSVHKDLGRVCVTVGSGTYRFHVETIEADTTGKE